MNLRIHRGAGAVLLLLALLAVVPGCLTEQAVREIVKDSNQAILDSNRRLTEGLAADLGTEAGTDWMETIARIDAFIAAHPDEKDLTTPLRLRQAMIFTVHAQDQLALATFELVAADASHLHTERDTSILAVHEHLVWWYRAAGKDLDRKALKEDGPNALDAFATQAKELDRMSDTRAYLEELSAQLAAQLAQNTTQEARAKTLLIEGVERYLGMFTEGEIEMLRSGNVEAVAGSKDVSLRRRLALIRAPLTLRRFQEVAVASGIENIAWEPTWIGPLMPGF